MTATAAGTGWAAARRLAYDVAAPLPQVEVAVGEALGLVLAADRPAVHGGGVEGRQGGEGPQRLGELASERVRERHHLGRQRGPGPGSVGEGARLVPGPASRRPRHAPTVRAAPGQAGSRICPVAAAAVTGRTLRVAERLPDEAGS